MGNLVIAIIGVVFATALLAAGIGYISPTAYIAHNQAAVSTAQVDSIVADYNNLTMVLGRRPTNADYLKMYPASSANSTYSYSATGDITIPSAIVPGASWAYMPGCGGGGSDCFCLTVPADAANPALVYKAAQMSANSQMNAATQSRVGISSQGCTDTATGTYSTNPNAWASATPTDKYYLTVRLTSTGTAATAVTYAATVNYGTCSNTCGSGTKPVLSYTCADSNGNNAPGKCAAPSAQSCYDTSGCGTGINYSYTGNPVWSPCTPDCTPSNSVTLISFTCTRDQDHEIVAPSYCGAPTPPSCPAYVSCNLQTTPGQCQANCGVSYQNPTYVCSGPPSNQPVPLSNCTDPQPVSVPCDDFTQCALHSTPGPCQPNCSATSTETPTYSCYGGSDAPTPVAISHCSSFAQPANVSCPDYSQCVLTPTPGQCPPGCITSTQSVTYTCQGGGNPPVANSYCPGPQPGTQSCAADNSTCHYTGTVIPGQCSSTCTNTTPGTETGTYGTCTRVEDNSPAALSLCGTPNPQPCTDNSGCVSYAASAPQYQCVSSNGQNCGGGTNNLTGYTCTTSVGGNQTSTYVNYPADSSPCTPPATTNGSCNLGPCTTYYYQPNTGSCYPACGASSQPITYDCYEHTQGQNPKQDSPLDCRSQLGYDPTGPSYPSSVPGCTDYSACTYTFGSSPGPCSATCGGGTQNPTYTCTRSDGKSVDPATYCSSYPQPTPVACNTQSCYTYSVYALPATSCSTTCGYGTTSISYNCIRSDGQPASAQDCINNGVSVPQNTNAPCEDNSLCKVVGAYSGSTFGCGVVSIPLGNYRCIDSTGQDAPGLSWCGTLAPNISSGASSSCPQCCTSGNGTDCGSYNIGSYHITSASYNACAPACGASLAPLDQQSWSCSFDGSIDTCDSQGGYEQGIQCSYPGSSCQGDCPGNCPQSTCSSNGQTPDPFAPCTSYATCNITPTYGPCDPNTHTKPVINYTCQDSGGHYLTGCPAPSPVACH